MRTIIPSRRPMSGRMSPYRFQKTAWREAQRLTILPWTFFRPFGLIMSVRAHRSKE